MSYKLKTTFFPGVLSLISIELRILLQERGHLHFVAALMTIVMAVAVLTSIAIARRIVKATSVLKARMRIKWSLPKYP